MDKIKLKNTDLSVSRICFGTMTFGGQTDEAASVRMVERCLEGGVNFFDTANVYNAGTSETMTGKALKGRRQRVVLASKVHGKMGESPDMVGLSRAAILRGVEDSLRRLETDFLDIYYLHQPDYDAPIEETLAAMDQLVRDGKVRYPACSNYSGWQVTQMLCVAEKHGYKPVVISQPMYNLLARGIEQEYLPMCKQFGVSTVVYNPLAGGMLTGKQTGEAPVRGTRFDKNRMYLDRYWHAGYFEAVEELRGIAERAGRSMVSLSLTWLLRHTQADCVILGASKLEQLDQNLKLVDDKPLDQATLEAVDGVWAKLRGVTPKYNR
ncbi:MAG: aldo/keto reductase [Bryobacteraceae bacterium]